MPEGSNSTTSGLSLQRSQGLGPHTHLPGARKHFPGRSRGSAPHSECYRPPGSGWPPSSATPPPPRRRSGLCAPLRQPARAAEATPAPRLPPPPQPVTAAAPGRGPPLLQHRLATGAGAVGFLPGSRTWRGPPPHGLLRHPTKLPARAGVGQRLGRWSVSAGYSAAAAAAAFSQPQQHGGSGHTERAPETDRSCWRGRARTLRRCRPSGVDRSGLAVTGWTGAEPGELVTPRNVGGAAGWQKVAAEKQPQEMSEKRIEKWELTR